MTSIAVRKSGGANIVSLPKAIVKTLGLHVGSKLDLTLEGNKIVLTPIKGKLCLEEILAGSPKDCFKIVEEDREWIDSQAVGKEI